MLRTVKSVIGRVLGEKAKGFFDYYRFPELRKAWGGPFNGQKHRQNIFAALKAFDFSAIMETGSFRGTTTELFARTGLPVFSCEGHPRIYGFARARLLGFRNVSLGFGDSRLQLRKILAELGPAGCGKPIFFYLDAHWQMDLPLAEELEIVLEACAQPVIMIDDFEVPDDRGYRFDRYGEGKSLIRSYIEPFISRDNLSLFYPAAPSADESGAKRGCAILVRADKREKMMAIAQLRLASP